MASYVPLEDLPPLGNHGSNTGRPRDLPPPGWERHNDNGRWYYYRVYDGASVWINPYVLGEVLSQELSHLLPTTWSYHAHWHPSIDLLRRAAELVTLDAMLQWAIAAADASWERQGGRAGNSNIWHRPRRMFNRGGELIEGTLPEPPGQPRHTQQSQQTTYTAGSSQNPPASTHSPGSAQQQES